MTDSAADGCRADGAAGPAVDAAVAVELACIPVPVVALHVLAGAIPTARDARPHVARTRGRAVDAGGVVAFVDPHGVLATIAPARIVGPGAVPRAAAVNDDRPGRGWRRRCGDVRIALRRAAAQRRGLPLAADDG